MATQLAHGDSGWGRTIKIHKYYKCSIYSNHPWRKGTYLFIKACT